MWCLLKQWNIPLTMIELGTRRAGVYCMHISCQRRGVASNSSGSRWTARVRDASSILYLSLTFYLIFPCSSRACSSRTLLHIALSSTRSGMSTHKEYGVSLPVYTIRTHICAARPTKHSGTQVTLTPSNCRPHRRPASSRPLPSCGFYSSRLWALPVLPSILSSRTQACTPLPTWWIYRQ